MEGIVIVVSAVLVLLIFLRLRGKDENVMKGKIPPSSNLSTTKSSLQINDKNQNVFKTKVHTTIQLPSEFAQLMGGEQKEKLLKAIAEATRLTMQGKKIEAIKVIRDSGNFDLKAAKDIVDKLEDNLKNSQNNDTASNS